MRPFVRLLAASAFVAAGPSVIAAPQPLFPDDRPLPKEEANWERSWVEKRLGAGWRAKALERFGTAPPQGPIRCTAEFEPSEGIVMAWRPQYLSTGAAFQTELAKVITGPGDAILYLQVPSESDAVSARAILAAADVDTTRVQTIVTPINSIWMRDYGPRYIYEGNVRAIVDHVYNRPRPDDDVFPVAFAAFKRHARYEIPLEHGGGNFHLDAGVNGFATRLIVNENPTRSAEQIIGLWRDYQGLEVTLLEPFPTNVDSTQHIDMWMIPVARDRVIISDWPQSVGSTQDVICDNAASELSARGYQVFRIPALSVPRGGGRTTHYTYTNATIVNNAVAIPSYTNSTAAPYNDEARAVWQAALPGHAIIPVDSQAIVGFSGVMHCITMHVPPNRLGAIPGVLVRSFSEPATLEPGVMAEVRWSSDDDHGVESVDVRLSTDGGATFPILLAEATPDDGEFQWTVPDVSTTRARVGVFARDGAGNVGQDFNDADLTITGGTDAVGWRFR